MKIRTRHDPDGYWHAIDEDIYDCDCDESGFFSTSPVGYGKTAQEAIDDLLAEINDREASSS